MHGILRLTQRQCARNRGSQRKSSRRQGQRGNGENGDGNRVLQDISFTLSEIRKDMI